MHPKRIQGKSWTGWLALAEHQSMPNRLSAVIWLSGSIAIHPFRGLPSSIPFWEFPLVLFLSSSEETVPFPSGRPCPPQLSIQSKWVFTLNAQRCRRLIFDFPAFRVRWVSERLWVCVWVPCLIYGVAQRDHPFIRSLLSRRHFNTI